MPYHHQSPYMQNQFTFIHDAILESVTCGDTQISATNLRTRIAKMKRNDTKNQPHGFQYQFKVCRFCMVRSRYPLIFFSLQILEQVSPNPKEIHCSGALNCPDRNRSDKYLPGELAYIPIVNWDHGTVVSSYIIICYDVPLFSADRWRVILKGEQPDYIHAVNINVSLEMISMNRNSIT